AVVGDGRGDLELQQHFLELHRGHVVALAAGDRQVAHFLALTDDRLALVAGDDARVGDDLAPAFLLQRRDLQVPVDGVAQDGQGQRAGTEGAIRRVAEVQPAGPQV